MPQRPREHVVGERAIKAVSNLIADAGYAVEGVENDYGEDLLVQTSHAGKLDASRLWFQVKGTEDSDRLKLKGGGFSLSVPFGHAVRWSRSADLVVAVLWDVRCGSGWYAMPLQQVDEWRGMESARRTTTLHFDETDLFDLAAVELLAWESRIEHYRLLTLSAKDYEKDFENQEGFNWSPQRVIVALSFASLIGLVEEHPNRPDAFRVKQEVRDKLAENFKLEDVKDDPKSAVYMAAIRTVFDCLNRRGEGLSLPRILIEETAEVLVTALDLKQVWEKAES